MYSLFKADTEDTGTDEERWHTQLVVNVNVPFRYVTPGIDVGFDGNRIVVGVFAGIG